MVPNKSPPRKKCRAASNLEFRMEGDCRISLTTQAEEEFTKAQTVFEDLNQELLEELPILYNR